METLEMKNVRRSLRGPLHRQASLCSPDKQTQLLTALRDGHIHTFNQLLLTAYIDVNYHYEDPVHKTCLEVACSEHKLAFVNALLRAGADPNIINESHKRAALHFAIEHIDVKIVERLLDEPDIDVNIRSRGKTPLFLLLKQTEEHPDNRDKYLQCIELLLKKNADINIPDLKGVTAVYLAAKNGYKKIIAMLFEQSKINVDIDSYKDRSDNSARNLIISKNLYSKLPEYNDKRVQTSSQLFVLLSQGKEDEFIEALKNFISSSGTDIVNANNGMYTLLQLAVDKGLERSVQSLLTGEADVNMSNQNYAPIEIASSHGYYNILKQLLAAPKIQVKHTILHIVVKNNNKTMKNLPENRDYNKCMDLLVHDKRVNVNAMDAKDNTALHYAARNGDHASIMLLLRFGACVSVRNIFKVPPLADIPAKTFETFLDECLDHNTERCTDVNYELIFKYGFLVPPNNTRSVDNQCSVEMAEESELFQNSEEEQLLVPETDALTYMCDHPELQRLIKHPVLTSFLFLKWHRIHWIFIFNLTFYVLFCAFLIAYILFGYGQSTQTPENAAVVTALSGILTFGAIMLAFREFFQMVISPGTYFTNIENWLEMPLMIITFNIAFHEPQEHIRQQLSAIAILLCAAELLLLIGQHPKFSTNIAMLRTVSWNFFKFLSWYSILIFAFSLSFYTLFREIDPTGGNSTTPEKEDDGENFFLDPAMSLFKTIVMLTGEFEAGSINFKSFPLTSHIIFVLFVFLIAIVLFNLLNGLAVSDISIIKKDAELVGYISRIRVISYCESMILGEIVPLRKIRQSLFGCALPASRPFFCFRRLAERICLFPKNIPNHKISVKPNDHLKVTSPHEKVRVIDEDDSGSGCCLVSWCKDLRMDSTVVKAAKEVIGRKNEVTEFDKINAAMLAFQESLSSCEKANLLHDDRLKHIYQVLENINNILAAKNIDPQIPKD